MSARVLPALAGKLPVAPAAMGLVAVVMLVFFYRRGWLGGARPDRPPEE